MNSFEIYVKEICSNCKNKHNCIEELRIKIDSSIKCNNYIKDKEVEGYKDIDYVTAKKQKPIMREILK